MKASSVFVCSLTAAVILAAIPGSRLEAQSQSSAEGPPEWVAALRHDTSRPLKDIAPVSAVSTGQDFRVKQALPTPEANQTDQAVQRFQTAALAATPGAGFDGVGEGNAYNVNFAPPLRAQLPAPNAAGVTAGHVHMMVTDPAAHRKVWVDILGAETVKAGSLELLKFPGIFLILGKAESAGGSEGSAVDHFSFRAKDLPGIRAKLLAAGVPLTRDDAAEIVAIFPDKVKVEFYAAPTISVPLEHFHVHFYTADPDGLRAWYLKHFGASMPTAANANAMGVPGISFSFRKTDAAQVATKGRSLDHIGFEVKDLEAFCKKLAADGVVFETPFRNVSALGLKIAFLIDPAGSRIELTEGLAGR